MITVERASHTDLYDQVNVIPFEEMDRFITVSYTHLRAHET